MVNLYGGIVKTTVVAEAFLKAYEDNVIDLPVFSRLKGTESEKAKEMLQGSRTKIFDSVEEAINAAVMGSKELTDIFGLLKGNPEDSDYEKKGVIVQGITGAYGSLHARNMMAYGTNVVAGVTPGKGGQKFEDKVPIYNTMQEAVDATNAKISIVFVPAKFFLVLQKMH